MSAHLEIPEIASRRDALIIAMNSRRATFSTALEAPPSEPRKAEIATEAPNVWASVGKGLATKWWQQHPAKLVVDVGLSALAMEAKRHPVRLLAASALVGATLAVAKPWRRIALGALAARFIQASVTDFSRDHPFNSQHET